MYMYLGCCSACFSSSSWQVLLDLNLFIGRRRRRARRQSPATPNLTSLVYMQCCWPLAFRFVVWQPSAKRHKHNYSNECTSFYPSVFGSKLLWMASGSLLSRRLGGIRAEYAVPVYGCGIGGGGLNPVITVAHPGFLRSVGLPSKAAFQSICCHVCA